VIILIIVKIFVTVGIVVSLSLVAEKISPRWAGLLSGYPTGTALSLFFFGLEISPQFAAASVNHNILGIIATLVFIYLYYRTSLHYSILPTLVIALAGYFCTVFLLHFIPLNTWLALVLTAIALIIFYYLFKPIQNVVIKEKIILRLPVLLIRGLSAAVIILIITAAAHVIGPVWSGLFSSFPTATLPLILIIHLTYNRTAVHTIIKYMPIGNVALVLYSLTVAFAYPRFGIYVGTAMAFAAATLYLLLYQLYKKIRLRI